LTRLTSNARVGGILSKKAGIVNVHVGRGKNFVGLLIEVVKKSDLPIAQFLPTHMNKGKESKFDEKGNFLKLDVADVCTLFKEVKDCVIQEDTPLEEALKVITSNPANFLKLENKGQIKEGFDADLLLLQKGTLNIEKVMAKGKLLMTSSQ